MADTTPTPAPDVFDQAAQASQAASAAQTQTAPAGAPQATGNSNGDIFDQLAANNSNGQSAPATAPAPVSPYYPPSISAAPMDETLAGKLQTWAGNVQADLRQGSSVTGVGQLLRSMSAHGFHGLDAGVSPKVAEYMGSLPLGLLQAVQGGAEIAQPGRRLAGAGDLASGLAQASTIPGSFIAPEAGEVAGSAINAGAKVAAKPLAHVAASFDPSSVQAPLQQAIRDVVASVAKDAGVTVQPSASVRDVLSNVADAVLEKSKGLYTQLDKASSVPGQPVGVFQRFDTALSNINREIRENIGLLSPEDEAALFSRKAAVEAEQSAAFDRARAAGVDPKLIDQASGGYKQGQALLDTSHQVRMASKGMRPELAGPGATPETLSPTQVFQRLSKMYDSGRLQQAVGSDRAGSLLSEIDQAFVQEQRIANRIKAAKTVGKVTGVGAAAAAAGQGAHLVKDALQ